MSQLTASCSNSSPVISCEVGGGPLLLPQLSRLSPRPRLTEQRPYLKAKEFDPLFHLLELAFSISFLAVENAIREIEKVLFLLDPLKQRF